MNDAVNNLREIHADANRDNDVVNIGDGSWPCRDVNIGDVSWHRRDVNIGDGSWLRRDVNIGDGSWLRRDVNIGDSSWIRRGSSSLNSVVTAISIGTGKVLGVAVSRL